MKKLVQFWVSAIWLAAGVPAFLIMPLLIALGVRINHEVLWIEYALIRTILGIGKIGPDAATQDVPPPFDHWTWWLLASAASAVTALVVYGLVRSKHSNAPARTA